MATYRNPWHKPADNRYGPASYETSATPADYGDHLIYERIKDHVWDVVKDGVCVTQMAGPNGARRAIDALNERAVEAA